MVRTLDMFLEPASGSGIGGSGVEHRLEHFGFEAFSAGFDLLAQSGIAEDFTAERAGGAADIACGLVELPAESDKGLYCAAFFSGERSGAAGAGHGRVSG